MRKVTMQVNGRVQGVGFRYLTKIAADELGVFGSVRNEDDGSVFIEAMGTEVVLAQFIEKVKASPSPMGRVTQFTLNEAPSLPDTHKFSIAN